MLPTLLQGVTTALEATASVLLVILYGALATRFLPFLSHEVVEKVSETASNIFLPSLIFTEMGKEASAHELRHLWILPVFNIAITAISLIYAYIGIKLLKLPRWIATAAAFPNLLSLPLLLVETLSVAGALHKLAIDDDEEEDVLRRARVYLLLTGLIGNIIRFAIGPRLLGQMKVDTHLERGGSLEDAERQPLLRDSNGPAEDQQASEQQTSNSYQGTAVHLVQKHSRNISELVNAPLLTAIVTLIVGLVRPLRKAFHSEGGALNASFTQSLKTMGKLYTGTATFFFGGSLVHKMQWRHGILSLIYLFIYRFVIVPTISIGAMYGIRKRYPEYIRRDPVLDFVLAISHTGPPAMSLVSIVHMTGLESHEEAVISFVLFASYLATPLMAFGISAALTYVDKLYT